MQKDLKFLELQQAMLAAGYRTKRELAAALGLNESTIYCRFAGRAPWTAWEMIALGTVLQIPLEQYGEMFCGQDLRKMSGTKTKSEIEKLARASVKSTRMKLNRKLEDVYVG